MRKLSGYLELIVGRVYNHLSTLHPTRGGETVMVLRTEPELVLVPLFSPYGDPLSVNIQGSEATYDNPREQLKSTEFHEPADESEWFKKSVRFTSLRAALDSEAINLEDVVSTANWKIGFMRTSPFTASMNIQWELLGVYQRFIKRDADGNFLPTIFVVWPSWEELYAEFKSFGVDVRG